MGIMQTYGIGLVVGVVLGILAMNACKDSTFTGFCLLWALVSGGSGLFIYPYFCKLF